MNNGSVYPTFIDSSYVGGTAFTNSVGNVDTTGVATDFYPATYNNERNGANGSFTYTLTGLTAGQSYNLKLHFAEIVFSSAGQRQFDVSVNGIPYLTNFDIIAEAGASSRAIVKSYVVSANSAGKIVVVFSAGAASVPKVSALEVFPIGAVTSGLASASASAVYQIACGSASSQSPYQADTFGSGGTIASYPNNTVITAAVNNPAPGAVYRTDRVGASSYTLANLVAGQVYTVRLHFAEKTHTQAGQRQFNVQINHIPVLTNFDIIGASGGQNQAVVETFPTSANSAGQIVVSLAAGNADQPIVSGIEVVTGFRVNSGGAGVGYWEADQSYNLGGVSQSTATVATTGVIDPAPAAVYPTQRYGGVSYTFHNLTPGVNYGVRLHFAEVYGPQLAGWREFNVVLNGAQVLTNFDIFGNSGQNQAIVEQFTTAATGTGQIVVAINAGASDPNGPTISGIELVAGGAGTGVVGAGQYRISGYVLALAGTSGGTAPVPGATLTLSGAQSGVSVSASDGSYSFIVNAGQNYTIAAAAPVSLPFALSGPLAFTSISQNFSNQNFTASFKTGGSLAPAAPNKEYIFMNGTIVAVEHPR